ncbi:DUF4256 domain-containing protein, partial [Acinetobacter baumannii]
MVDKKQLTQKQIELLLELFKNRFEKNTHRHTEIEWSDVQNKLIKVPDKLWSLL